MNATAQYRYLWDGSEPGWVLALVSRQYVKLYLNFDKAGPTVKEIKSLRLVVPTYGELSATEAFTKLRGKASLDLGEFESREGRHIAASCRRQGLVVTEIVEDRSGYLPINELTNIVLVIEDNVLSQQVSDEALRNGLVVRHIEA
jgi:hypothetical protein